ncbi:hypothetical protein EGW08_010628 [Elysia chlorotica]|uniref:Metalloendopeptidase n=1 Tax=Elysia chlorotica TaxID=188477 RepID=A0A433TJC7_ELYCH|nr:hypothetical protein EGW08_010628 [Elysia chlorotica]
MEKRLLWSRGLLTLTMVALISQGTLSAPDGPEGEGVVEQYILAREEAEYELEDFYTTALPGDEPDFNSDAMENLRICREQLYEAGLPAKDVADLIKGDPGLERAHSAVQSFAGMQKRTIEVKPSRRWTAGLVPYVFTDSTSTSNRVEIIRSIRTYERFTCMRYIPWSEENGVTTNNKLGLDHESYLSFINGGGCWSFQGNLRKPAGAGGQKISCCGGVTCIHEIGHAMGESHEHQSPNPDRDRMIRINFDGISSGGRNSYIQHTGRNVKSLGYDLSSYMHYATWSFRISGKQTFHLLFPEMPYKNSYYYMMREISMEHNCQDKCKEVPMTCENDGYLTLVDNKCACMCIPGLDPATGCTSVFKKDPEGISFPGGNYAFPAHSTGCPDDSFTLGSRTQVNAGGNYKRSPFDIGFNVSDNKVEKKFCIKDSPANDVFWPGANFCMYRRGDKCPEGFNTGFVQYDDLPTETSPNAQSGDLPDGIFDDDTRFEFCCSDTGFSDDELVLPSRKPFVLIKRRGKDCQKVRGMHVETNTLRVGNAQDDGTALVGGDHPMYQQDKNTKGFWTAYCNYKPAMIDCGDVIDLDDSNTEVTISSPKAPELECHWLIKAPKGEKLKIDFTDFNIEGKPGRCIDDLEIRFARPGQPGVKYCGSRLDKTTISINNTIHLRLSTYGDSSSHFTATVKLVKNDDLCYSVEDRGMTYDGDVNFTRNFEPCLPWAKMTHCEMHPYKTDKFNTILEGNKCRNPDQSTGFQPWCYTDAENCIRDYCDVCLVGKRFDRVDNCANLKAAGQCVLNHCAKTCADQEPEPAVPVKASDVRCSAPGPAPDGAPVDASKDSYAVGETVMYKCEYSESTKLRYCLTSGQWSPMGTVCSECPENFYLNMDNNKCYYFPNLKMSADDAIEFCQEKKSFVAYPITEEENVYLKSVTPDHILIGITDKEVEGTFVTVTGEPVAFTKWGGVEPNNYGNREDCTEINKAGTWNDLPCTGYLRHFVCQTNMTPPKDCLDFSDKCAELFTANPAMCSEFPTFADKSCRYTCGLCGKTDSPTCKASIPETGDIVELTRGMSVASSCGEGLVPVSGDAVRGCQKDGTLTGSVLECIRTCPEGWTINLDNMYCYKKFETRRVFKGAVEDCAANSGILATAYDAKEQAFVSSLKGSGKYIWLGLDDIEVEGTFKWADGSLLAYTNWNTVEPNNAGKNGEDCVQMIPNGKWNDKGCNFLVPYICKVDVEVFGE